MASEIERLSQPGVLDAWMRYAKALATSGLLPASYRSNPANVLFAIEYGRMLGLPPMGAIQGINVIAGKPAASAELIGGLVRRAGHKLRVNGDDKHAKAVIIRQDDPGFEYVAEWDLDKARKAGLLSKDSWKNYPTAMLKARAITEVARAACSEVLSGLSYTPEELGAEVDADGEVVVEQTPGTEQKPEPDPEQFLDRETYENLKRSVDESDSPAAVETTRMAIRASYGAQRITQDQAKELDDLLDEKVRIDREPETQEVPDGAT